MKRVTVVLLILLASVVALADFYDSDTPMARWSPPTEGSPVVEYVLQLVGDGQVIYTHALPDTFHRIPEGVIQPFVEYFARVAGRDAQDRQGPWSLPSEIYVYDPGPPGAPGSFVWID